MSTPPPAIKRSASSPLPTANEKSSPFSPAARRTASKRLPPYLASFEDVDEGEEQEDEGVGQLQDEGDRIITPKRNLAITLPSRMWSPINSPSHPPPSPPEEKGFTLNPEELEFQGHLAEGAYGVVWRARLRGKQVAVKVQRLPCDEHEQANLLCELMILQGLAHPRLVRYEGAAFLEAEQARSCPEWTPLLRAPEPPKPSLPSPNKGYYSMVDEEEEPEHFDAMEEEGEEGEQQVQQASTPTPTTITVTEVIPSILQPPPHEDPLILIAMELCWRGSLRQGLHSEALAWPLKVRIAGDIAEGLAFLHGQGLIHRDLKTTNILLDAGWRAKICDHSFAIAQRSPDISSFTCGTLEFMSPEVALNEPYDAKCDMFSLGVVICEMAAEKEPGVNGFLVRRSQDLFHLPASEVQASVLPECPPSLLNLALQCVEHDPEHRPTSKEAFEWAQSLFAELGGEAPVLPNECSSPSSSHPDRDYDDEEDREGRGGGGGGGSGQRGPLSSQDDRKAKSMNWTRSASSPPGTPLTRGSVGDGSPVKSEGKKIASCPREVLVEKEGDKSCCVAEEKGGGYVYADEAKHGRGGYGRLSSAGSPKECHSSSSSSSEAGRHRSRRRRRGRRRQLAEESSADDEGPFSSTKLEVLDQVLKEVDGLKEWKARMEHQQEQLMEDTEVVRDHVGAILSSVTALSQSQINTSSSLLNPDTITSPLSPLKTKMNHDNKLPAATVTLSPSSSDIKITSEEQPVIVQKKNGGEVDGGEKEGRNLLAVTKIEGWESDVEKAFKELMVGLKELKLSVGGKGGVSLAAAAAAVVGEDGKENAAGMGKGRKKKKGAIAATSSSSELNIAILSKIEEVTTLISSLGASLVAMKGEIESKGDGGVCGDVSTQTSQESTPSPSSASCPLVKEVGASS